MNLKEIFEKSDEDRLVLPDFQREFEWNKDAQKRLLSSFFVSIPIGSLLILEGKKDDFLSKKLCFAGETIEPTEECLYLLDGQQRVSSLRSTFYDFFQDKHNWLNIWEKMYSGLRNRWFLKIKPDNEEEDVFGWRMLNFKGLKYCEPSDLINCFEHRYIYKRKSTDWYHPGYKLYDKEGKELEGSRLKNKLAREAAKMGLVPLYSIYGSIKTTDKQLHTYVLEKIAKERVEELQAEVEDGKIDVFEIFQEIEPDIEEYIENNEIEKIRDAWSRLSAKWSESVNKFLVGLFEQEIPTIDLPSDQISRAIAIFENINKGGTPLDTFDLIVAKAARTKGERSLSQRISDYLEEEIDLSEALTNDLVDKVPDKWDSTLVMTIDENKITKTIKNQYLNLLSLFSHVPYGEVDKLKLEYIKRAKIFELTHEQINTNTNITLKALTRACAFLQIRCGLIDIKSLSYDLMILPIAYILKNDDVYEDKRALARIEYWYWSSLFSGAYRERQNEQCIKDIKNLFEWIKGGENKFKIRYENILNDIGYSDKTVLLRKDQEHNIPKAIHNGILQYILSKQPVDFLPNAQEKLRLNAWEIGGKKIIEIDGNKQTISVEDHHICPLGTVTKIGETSKKLRNDKKHILNSILNRTYISSIANAKISDKSPERYMKYVMDSAQWGHYLPIKMKEIFEEKGKSLEQKYEAILENRYNMLKRAIKEELDRLEDM
ncbi:DUF262 domain-containing protein [Crassaminicella thermophila]|nr:DUF262 domain-containing protein [Crassaminicella thermophila]